MPEELPPLEEWFDPDEDRDEDRDDDRDEDRDDDRDEDRDDDRDDDGEDEEDVFDVAVDMVEDSQPVELPPPSGGGGWARGPTRVSIQNSWAEAPVYFELPSSSSDVAMSAYARISAPNSFIAGSGNPAPFGPRSAYLPMRPAKPSCAYCGLVECRCNYCCLWECMFGSVKRCCNKCERCCRCRECKFCKVKRKPHHFCTSQGCGRCRECCLACMGDGKRAIGFYRMGLSPDLNAFYPKLRKERKANPLARLCSLEIETTSLADGHPLIPYLEKWNAQVVYDCSLGERGIEICTSPAGGDILLEQLLDLSTALSRSSPTKDDRCGLHVHVDARDLSYYDIKRLITLYAQLEPALFFMIPPARRGNRFCVPCGQTLLKYRDNERLFDYIAPDKNKKKQPHKDVKARVQSAIYMNCASALPTIMRDLRNVQKVGNLPGRARDHYRDLLTRVRYRALNLHSWIYRRTIECRLYPGTFSYDDWANWAMLWAGIIEWVATHKDSDVKPNIAGLVGLKAMAVNSAVTAWVSKQYRRWSQCS